MPIPVYFVVCSYKHLDDHPLARTAEMHSRVLLSTIYPNNPVPPRSCRPESRQTLDEVLLPTHQRGE